MPGGIGGTRAIVENPTDDSLMETCSIEGRLTEEINKTQSRQGLGTLNSTSMGHRQCRAWGQGDELLICCYLKMHNCNTVIMPKKLECNF